MRYCLDRHTLYVLSINRYFHLRHEHEILSLSLYSSLSFLTLWSVTVITMQSLLLKRLSLLAFENLYTFVSSFYLFRSLNG